jgi:hypothetical protein
MHPYTILTVIAYDGCLDGAYSAGWPIISKFNCPSEIIIVTSALKDVIHAFPIVTAGGIRDVWLSSSRQSLHFFRTIIEHTAVEAPLCVVSARSYCSVIW